MKLGKPVAALLSLCFAVSPALAEVTSLSHLFAPGKGLLDRDGDGCPDAVGFTIVIPDNPTAYELALAADLAGRANLESLVADYRLVRRESEVGSFESLTTPILIGSGLAWLRDAARERRIDLAALPPNEGMVFTFSVQGRRGIACAAGSGDALLKTGRAFFLRWPYFWEVWGRETGATFLSLESDLGKFFAESEIGYQTTLIDSARYRFPAVQEATGALRALDLRGGEIAALSVQAFFADESDLEKGAAALRVLRAQRALGERTEVLSYPSVERIDFGLGYGKTWTRVDLPRSGSSKRLLTAAFKEPPRVEPAERDFDLLSVVSAKGLYADQDGDGILDGIESTVVIPASLNGKALCALAAKLVLPTAGASFPLVRIDKEVESRRGLISPVLVGPNALTGDLVKTGKLKVPPLDSARGLIRVVPKAFNKTPALVFTAPDAAGLEKTLEYFARTFPRFGQAREGGPDIARASRDFEAFLAGERGAAEAWFSVRLQKFLEDMDGRDVEKADVKILLPGENPEFADSVRRTLAAGLKGAVVTASAGTASEARTVFEAKRDFAWEVDDAVAAVREAVREVPAGAPRPLRVRVGVSESAEVRKKVRRDIERVIQEAFGGRYAPPLFQEGGPGGSPIPAGFAAPDVEVLSAYKPGFSWLTERVAPLLKGKPVHRLVVRFARETDDPARPKRFHAEPSRWLQELYPVDDILARELALPVDRIAFEMSDQASPVYRATALDEKGAVLLEQDFSPRVREVPMLSVVPEWGTAKVTTGWVRVESGPDVLADRDLPTDLERFWSFYQDEVLKPLRDHVMAKTGKAPTFSKQPYFKRLLVELWLSEPDAPLGLDQEIVSSLESMHDEVYFDTLDLLRGMTGPDPDEMELPPDTSRSSAPGNVLPIVHSSLEGTPGRARAVLEDVAAAGPEMEIRWTERGAAESVRKETFPKLKPKAVRMPGLVYDGQNDRVESLALELETEKESEYTAAIDILASYRDLAGRGLLQDAFRYPGVDALAVTVKLKELEKEESLPVLPPAAAPDRPLPPPAQPGETLVPTDRILSPADVLDIVGRLGRYPGVRSYVGGTSYEKRDIPVVEMYLPNAGEVSIARLTTFKPTLQVSCRQHANEVSSSNYGLRFLELLARDRAWQDALKRMNVVVQPVENPDGAAMASELARTEPFHCLHAGRYGALGMDIGYQTPSNKMLLPEATVRAGLMDRWRPDVYLNLHGYPSHEWVQVFTGYVPYLFRDYWIPRGWFAYYKAVTLPVYEAYRQAGEDLRAAIVQEMGADERSRESNRRFYDRFQRWAGRWQPHLNYLELYDGLDVYAKRRGPQETRATGRTQTTFVEQTPEVMDETASGVWLQSLCEQGLTYLRAHVKYLSQAKSEVARIEEETRDRVRISFQRARPGKIKK